jgi:fructose-1-phosphate kinase PfkB-like protein
VVAAMPPRRARGSPQVPSGDSMSPAAMLAAMQAMQQELAILRQAILVAHVGVSHPGFRAPRPGREHNHQVCWDQVSHI